MIFLLCIRSRTILSALIVILAGCGRPRPPAPCGAVPSPAQLEWHRMKYYAFIHFGPNTFTGKEWGYGDESPALFNPTALDCRQWARVARDAGMEAIIITAKHHDGFCLWPSAYTGNSVSYSPWKDGKGDVLKELREACNEYGLRMGIYLSPWDRNHPAYGTPAYIDYYRNQLRELLGNYGEIFEVWFDGANGGDGYYGGARETRTIDNTRYYDWENTHRLVRELQPRAVMFSDGGPDVRWIGNEQGYAGETNWCTVKKGLFYPGVTGMNDQLMHGHEDGELWLPAEVNTSIRPGWFYHASQDNQVKSLDQLVENWFHSVGMNGNFLLNLPPDQRGLIHENDVQRLMELKKYLDASFSADLARGASIRASGTRKGFRAKNCLDGDPETYWASGKKETEVELVISFPETVTINTILLQEYIALGQRVRSFTIEALQDRTCTKVAGGTTIGNRRLVRFEETEAKAIRITLWAKACPLIASIEVYKTPG